MNPICHACGLVEAVVCEYVGALLVCVCGECADKVARLVMLDKLEPPSPRPAAFAPQPEMWNRRAAAGGEAEAAWTAREEAEK